jgi:hypothetical protein
MLVFRGGLLFLFSFCFNHDFGVNFLLWIQVSMVCFLILQDSIKSNAEDKFGSSTPFGLKNDLTIKLVDDLFGDMKA